MHLQQQKNGYYYQAFGLVIRSEIDFPQLVEVGASNDCSVEIICSRLDYDGRFSLDKQFSDVDNDGSFWLNLPELVLIRIEAGGFIKLSLYDNADIQAVRLYVLGSCMAILAYQMGSITLHGCAIAVGEDKAIIVVADSGTGKSALATWFTIQGYPVLTDDVSIVRNGQVYPGYPFIKIWQDTLLALQLDDTVGTKIHMQRDKYYYPIDEQFCDKPLKVAAVYAIIPSQSNDWHASPAIGALKFQILLRFAYRRHYISLFPGDKKHKIIERYTSLSQTVPIYRVDKPMVSYGIDKMGAFFLNHFKLLGL